MENARKHLVILVVVDILICTAILLGISYFKSFDVISRRVEEKAELMTEAYAQELGVWMTGYSAAIDNIATQMAQEKIVKRSNPEIHQYLKTNLENINANDEIEDLYYTTIDNEMISAMDDFDQGDTDYVHDREWFTNAAAGSDLYYSKPYLDSVDNRVCITLSKAVRVDNSLCGVFCADIIVETLVNKVNEAEVDADSYAFLIDSDYEVIAHPCDEFSTEGEPLQLTDAKSVDYSVIKDHLVSDRRDVHYLKDYDGIERAFSTAVIPGMRWYVGIATSSTTLKKDINSLSIVYIISGMATLVIGLIIIIVFTSRFVRQRRVSGKEAIKKFGVKNILASVGAVLFFVALIVIYVSMLYSTSKDSIMSKGELHSEESANTLNAYVTQGMNIVNKAKYEINKKMKRGCDKSEILQYLVENTDSIQKTIDDNYTGLYAYIDGKYYDGANWVPDKDWVATERPWYKKAVGANGRTILIEPYIDAQTGLMTMTVASTLDNKQNVVAIDVSFSMMKSVTSDSTDEADKIEMVLDSNGYVIAHTDVSEIGKNYRDENNTLGAAVAEALYANNRDQCFEIDYGGINYVVYSVSMNNQWYSLTLIDSKESYKPLRVIVIVTIFVIILTVTILILIFVNLSSKSLAVDRMNTQLSATSDIYMSAHDIDLLHDTFEDLHMDNRVMAYREGQDESSARDLLYNMTGAATLSDTRKGALEFVDLHTLNERMKDTDSITMEFHVKSGTWMRGRFIVSERDSDGDILHVLWLVESIDEEKKQRETLQSLSERAIAQSEAKSAFLSNMSHEIRTPITAVLGMNEMILRECNDENIRNYSESIDAAGHTLLGLINDILDFSKIEAGKMEILPVEYDLALLLNDLVNMTQMRTEEKGLVLKTDFDSSLPNILYGDEVRVKQIITNVLTNAVKYTEKGSVTFTMGYNKDQYHPDQVVLLIAVKDTGIGIKKEAMDKLFARFERIEEDRNRNIEGTGLGMTITRRLLDMMGGTLDIESEYGRGSTFRIIIRQRVVEWTPIGDYEEAFKRHMEEKDRYKQYFTAPDARILVVDDTKINLKVIKSLLKSTLVQLDTAMSGDEGLELMQKNAYDLILLDHMMPEKNGIETLHEMRANDINNPNLETPVICLTANAISGAREMYMKEGFDNYLTKPIDSTKLEEMLASYLPKDKVRYTDDEKNENTKSAPVEQDKPVQAEVASDEKEKAAEPADTPDVKEEPAQPKPDKATAKDSENKGNKDNKDGALSPLYKLHTGIDIIGAMKGMGGEEAYKPILDIFYESIDEMAEEIDSHYRSEQWEDYMIQVHALKSSARIVGAMDLGDEAFEMEMAAKKKKYDYIHENHEALLKHLRAFTDILSDIYS